MPTDNNSKKRPTKKQFELLEFIKKFIAEHGYGPSYREIMAGCNYSSVATVAVHVNNLAAHGHLNKKGRSARSLELTAQGPTLSKTGVEVKPSDEKWLVQKIESLFDVAEDGQPSKEQIDNLYVLVGALKVLGFSQAANSFIARLKTLKNSL